MSKEESQPLCGRCKKPLENVPCKACNGQGYYKEWVVTKKVCHFCNGSGQVLRCPDEAKHIFEDFKIPKNINTERIYQTFRKGKPFTHPSAQTYGLAKPPDTKVIPPPWAPNYPNPWHPNHPLNPNNPNSPIARNLSKPDFPNNPFNWNNPASARKNANWGPQWRLPGGPSTDAPPPKKK